MKKIIAVFALICVFAAAGCNNGEAPKTTTAASSSETTTTTAAVSADENGNNSQVVFDNTREDTTAEALAYLEQKAPLFKSYLDIRRSVPLTFETTVVADDGEYKTGLYIKDAENFAQYSKDPDGNEMTVIYMKDTAYQISSADKLVYKYDCGPKEFTDTFDGLTMKTIYLDDVEAAEYDYGTGEMEGKTYLKIAVSTNSEVNSIMYFDADTNDLKFIGSETSVARVDKLENSFTKEEIFNIPSDYEVKSFNDLLAEYQAQAEAEMKDQIASQNAETSAAAEETTESSAETTE